jgi:hypothetical protein
MARRPSRSGSARTASSDDVVWLDEETPCTHARCPNCEEVREVKFERIGESAPIDIVCKVCHYVIAILYKGDASPPPSP